MQGVQSVLRSNISHNCTLYRDPKPLFLANLFQHTFYTTEVMMFESWLLLCGVSALLCALFMKVRRSALNPTPSIVALFTVLIIVGKLCHTYLSPLGGLAVFCGACWLASGMISTRKWLPVEGKAVLITGCDSGFGKAVAHHLDSMGVHVYATVLNLEGPGAKDLQMSCSKKMQLIQVDITKSEDIKHALQIVRENGKGLWGLVNNAGVCVNFGDAELSLMSTYRGCMDINFFGTLEMTKTFLPLVRQSKGRIVTVSSPSAEQTIPLLAAYSASKAAISMFTSTLRQEIRQWGVEVCLIFPGAFKTGSQCQVDYWEKQHSRLLEGLPADLLHDYGEEYISETKQLFFKHTQRAATDLSPVVESITDALFSINPKARYLAGKGMQIGYLIHQFMPEVVRDWFCQKLFISKKVLPRVLEKQQNFKKNHLK
ncbi:corticosteroid 11-beta-dehydrogenase isozyme 2 [Protopterus annectens]|uniref:corticosteroid 11-beta-dehydrogenase isozyme 2 n=1 Tax=Protopterus annectens TaxID=7888 RepID=UPI001CFBC15B|nr:corticosteroid 11-beta-dehydrogenase isozyme 2 [Protopterus annectens]